jgi:hypothetical protein
MECIYCNLKFVSVSSLNYHQRHTKKCLTIQNNIKQKTLEDNIVNNLQLKIIDFEKINQDYEKKITEYNIKITEYEQKISDLEQNEKKITQEFNDKIQDMLMKLASKPTNNNTTINHATSNKILNMNMLKTDQEEYSNIFSNSNIDTIDRLVDTLYKTFTDENGNLEYICTDPSRNMFKFRDKDNVLRKDPQANTLISIIQKPLNETIKVRQGGLMKYLADNKYNYTEEQKDAEVSFFAMSEMKDLNEETANKVFCKKLSTKCVI